MKVSVIIQVYNTKKYLTKCLDSVINQTLEDIEIICIDRGSIDGSLDILKKYKANYNNLTIINVKNENISIEMNKIIKQSLGEYIYLLNSYDYINSDMLERAYNESKENNLDLGIIDCRVFSENDKSVQSYSDVYGCLGKKVYIGIDVFNNIKNGRGNYLWNISTQFYKKEFAEILSINCDKGIYYTVKSLLIATRVKHIGGILFNHRKIVNSKLGLSIDNKYREECVYALKALIDLYNNEEQKMDCETSKNLKLHINYFSKLLVSECNKQLDYNNLMNIRKHLTNNSMLIDIELAMCMDTPALWYKYRY